MQKMTPQQLKQTFPRPKRFLECLLAEEPGLHPGDLIEIMRRYVSDDEGKKDAKKKSPSTR